jgi:hypothetical protein
MGTQSASFRSLPRGRHRVARVEGLPESRSEALQTLQYLPGRHVAAPGKPDVTVPAVGLVEDFGTPLGLLKVGAFMAHNGLSTHAGIARIQAHAAARQDRATGHDRATGGSRRSHSPVRVVSELPALLLTANSITAPWHDGFRVQRRPVLSLWPVLQWAWKRTWSPPGRQRRSRARCPRPSGPFVRGG